MRTGKEQGQSVSYERARKKEKRERKYRTRDFLHSIIESSLDCIVVSDRRGYLTRVNSFFLDLTGYSREEAIGKHISEFAPPEIGNYELVLGESVEIKQEFYDNQLTMMAVLREKEKVSNWNAYYCRKDMKLIPVEQNIMYLYNETGERSGSVGISRDVTERKQAEEKLSETTAFLDNIIESSQDCILASETKGYFTRVNKSFLELLGYSKEEVLGARKS